MLLLLLPVLLLLGDVDHVTGNTDAKRLYEDLLHNSGYTKHARPRAKKNESRTIVKLGLSLSQIIHVDEKNEMFTINVRLNQQWEDYVLTWDPSKYGNISRIFVPSTDIWIPDIVLYNSADVTFGVPKTVSATLHHNGVINWNPPVTYQSLCAINVELFPFDSQECYLKFGSWTHDTFAVDIRHFKHDEGYDLDDVISNGTDIEQYSISTEWDILSMNAKWYAKNYPCCNSAFSDIKFNFTIRRKTLFYTINLVIPCVAICSLTIMVFYLPAECCEKITLCTTILTCLTFFLNLVLDINPPTSKATPLIGKYILFTMCVLVLSILMTVLVLNIHFRTPATHTMSPLTRHIFLEFLPKLLLMRPPMSDKVGHPTMNGVMLRGFFRSNRHFSTDMSALDDDYPTTGRRQFRGFRKSGNLSTAARQAMIGVGMVAKHLREQDAEKKAKEDWQYIARVMDRFFLWTFTAVCVVATAGMFLAAKAQEDKRPAIDQ